MEPMISRLLSDRRGFYHTMVEFPGYYIYRNDSQNNAYNRLCSEQMDATVVSYVKKVVLMMIGGYGYAASTLYASFWLHNKTTLGSLKIPHVEEKSDAEFHYNFTLQNIIFAHGYFFYLGMETTMTIFENFATVSPKLIHLELSKCIASFERKEMTEPQLRVAFKNALLEILDYERWFTNCLNNR